MRLAVDADDLAMCVSCGLCLPHCPTFRVSGDETRSPRGRVTAMRVVDSGLAEADDSFVRVMDECVLCRGCEPACPSGVPFGRLMEGARRSLAAAPALHYQRRWRRVAYGILGSRALLVVLSTVAAVAQRARLVPRRAGLPRLPLRRPALRASGSDAWLFTGCVMDAWMRPVHVAVQEVLTAAGVGVALPGSGGACCGALHGHAGLVAPARRLAKRVISSMPGDAPILVDSAGCGAAMKDYGELLGTPDAHAFAARVYDVHEWLAGRLHDLPPGESMGRVAIQDPCHLRHVQRTHAAVRDVLGRYAEVVELDDDGLCCGAGGAYAAQHGELATAIRDLKVAAIGRTGAPVVASANPGCMLHLRAAGIDARHPLDLVATAIAGSRAKERGRSGR